MLGFWVGWEKWACTGVLCRIFQKQSDVGSVRVECVQCIVETELSWGLWVTFPC